MDRGYATEPPGAPYRALLIATVIAIGCIGLMALAFTTPIDPDCFEWCGLGRYIATAGISLVSFAWLIVFIVLGWRLRARRTAYPVISCLAAAGAWGTLFVLAMAPWTALDTDVYVFFQLGSILGLGVAMPAVWHVQRLSGRSAASRGAVVIMLLAIAAAIGAYIAIGTTWYTDGPTYQWIASLIWHSALVALIAATWLWASAAQIPLSLLGLGAALEVVIGVMALGFHLSAGVFGVVPLVLITAGWLLLACVWSRHGRRMRDLTTSEVT